MTETIAAPAETVAIFAGTVTLAELAAENGGCERSWRNAMDRLNVPCVKVLGTRRYRREAVRAAILRGIDDHAAPRGRGRPRKHAA